MDGIGSIFGSTPPKLTLVIGGARSGKSVLAQRLVEAAGLPRTFIATATPGDAEMAARIARHQADRGPGWSLVEAPLDLATALAAAGADGIVLVDCATLWLSNHLLAGHDTEAETARLLDAIATCPATLVIVTNEVGWSVVPDNALARAFADAQGRLNQRLAAAAQRVVATIAGLPFVLKDSR
jgi:adenosylcobinamide kinase/adenosylcobinamide-phosphate guanylyltransferase